MSSGGMGNTSLMGYGGQGGGMGRFGGFNDPYNQPKGRFGGSPFGGMGRFGGSPFGGGFGSPFGGSPFGGMQKPFYPGEQNQPPGRGAATSGGYANQGRPVGDFGPGGNSINNLSPFGGQTFSGVGGSGFTFNTPGAGFKGPARVPEDVTMGMNPEGAGGASMESVPKGGATPSQFVPNGGVGQPGQYAAPNPGENPMGMQPPLPPGSGQQAYDSALAQYNSPEYAAYYNSLAPSTRAYMNAPGSAQTGQYLGDMARNNYNAFGAYPWSR